MTQMIALVVLLLALPGFRTNAHAQPVPGFLPDQWNGWNCSDPKDIKVAGTHLAGGEQVPGFAFSPALTKDAVSACFQTPLGNGWYVQAFRKLHSDVDGACAPAKAPCEIDGVRLCQVSFVGVQNNPAQPICEDPALGQPKGFGPLGCEKCSKWRTSPK
jgi:hypothetical protein